MKKTLIIVLFIFTFLGANAQNNIIKFNILSFAVGTANVAFEKKVTESSSFQIRGFYMDMESAWLINDIGVKGYGIIPEYRVYFSKNSPKGFYAAPFFKYQDLEVTSSDKTETGRLETFGGGVITGVHWIFGDIFSLDLFLGPAFNFGEVEGTEADIETGSLDGFGVRSGFTIGFVF
ncbi:MAG: DUF3575 domain-containing protein [Candidatus Cyclobacteriaceae bacterium M2_1C_046]